MVNFKGKLRGDTPPNRLRIVWFAGTRFGIEIVGGVVKVIFVKPNFSYVKVHLRLGCVELS